MLYNSSNLDLVLIKSGSFFISMIAFGLIFLIPNLINLNDNWQIKLGFLAKISLMVGFIGLWLFTILPNLGEKKNELDAN